MISQLFDCKIGPYCLYQQQCQCTTWASATQSFLPEGIENSVVRQRHGKAISHALKPVSVSSTKI